MPHQARFPVLLAAVVVAACSSDGAGPDPVLIDTPPADSVYVDSVVPGEVLVKMHGSERAQVVANAHGAFVRDGSPDVTLFMGRDGGERKLAAELERDPRVEWAEPNYVRRTHAIDPRLWAFYNPGGLVMRVTATGKTLPASRTSIADADMDNIEGIAAGGTDVVIGSIDSGVDFSHPELAGRLIAGKDWLDHDNDPTDLTGHGTHTTGIMAGRNVGVAGVSGAWPHVRVYVQRVCDDNGCPASAIVSAIRAAADFPGMVAINLSVGGGAESKAEKDAIKYATGKGVLVIASAGNNGSGSVACPACDVNAIAVSSTNWRDALASYSQHGKAVDLAAPGGECWSNTSKDGCIYSSWKNGGYAWEQGTSMAAPQVTGIAAIVASVDGLRGTALRARLESTADDMANPTKFGKGRVNAYRAVTGSVLGGNR